MSVGVLETSFAAFAGRICAQGILQLQADSLNMSSLDVILWLLSLCTAPSLDGCSQQGLFFHVQVAASVTLLDRDFSDPRKTSEVNVQQYAAGSYAAITKQELDIRLKKAPIAFHSEPLKGLFDTASPIAGFSFG